LRRLSTFILLILTLLILVGCNTTDTTNNSQGPPGQDGSDGLTPHIGENGNWWIGNTDTGVKAVADEVLDFDRIPTDGLHFIALIQNGELVYKVSEYTGDSSEIIIPSEIKGNKVVGLLGNPFRDHVDIIEKISISKHFTEIPRFDRFPNLVEFDFNHAKLYEIPIFAFANNHKMKYVKNYEHVEKLGHQSFASTQVLHYGFDFSNIKVFEEHAFYFNSNYVTSHLGLNYDRETLEVLGPDFIFVPETDVEMPKEPFPASTIVYFEDDRKPFSSNKFSNVRKTDDGYWYSEYEDHLGILNYTGELEEINIPSTINGKPVTKVESYAFVGNKTLKKITLPNTISEIGTYAFATTLKLGIVYIPESVTSVPRYFLDYSSNDTVSKIVAFPTLVFENPIELMTFEDYTFDDITRPRVIFGFKEDQIKQNDNFIFIERDNSIEILGIKNTKEDLIIPSTINGKEVLRIRSNALFRSNGGIKTITVEEGIKHISQMAFNRSLSLEKLYLPSTLETATENALYELTNTVVYINLEEKPEGFHENWETSSVAVIWNE